MSVILSVGLGVAVVSVGVTAACLCAKRKRKQSQQSDEVSKEIDDIFTIPRMKTHRQKGGQLFDVKDDMFPVKPETAGNDALEFELLEMDERPEEEVESHFEGNHVILEQSLQSDEESNELDSDSDVEDKSHCGIEHENLDAANLEPEVLPLFNVSKLKDIADSVDDEDLRGLMVDRVAEFTDVSRLDDDCALSAVDFLDELSNIESAYSEPLSFCIASMKSVIKSDLLQADYEILDSDTWTPEIQRAVKISHTLEPDAFPLIAAKRASGLRCKGRLIRKQEVELLKS